MKLAPIFTDHMVFAAGKPVRIFGTGAGRITAEFNGFTGKCEADGSWLITLPSMPYGGPYTLTVRDGEGCIELTDIYVGDVYLCSGQSNMQMMLDETLFPPEKCADNDLVRFYATARLEDNEPFFPKDGWMLSTRETAGRRTAIGYMAAYGIVQKKNVAVGIISCYQGASVIESWVPEGTFDGIGDREAIEKCHLETMDKLYWNWNHHGQLYHFALQQVLPLSMTAVIWYQGESDAHPPEAFVYGEELTALIARWRGDFMDEALPFVVIQLADHTQGHPVGWKAVQDAQLAVGETVPGVRTVICRDDCEPEPIHPRRKEVLSARVVDALMELT